MAARRSGLNEIRVAKENAAFARAEGMGFDIGGNNSSLKRGGFMFNRTQPGPQASDERPQANVLQCGAGFFCSRFERIDEVERR